MSLNYLRKSDYMSKHFRILVLSKYYPQCFGHLLSPTKQAQLFHPPSCAAVMITWGRRGGEPGAEHRLPFVSRTPRVEDAAVTPALSDGIHT